MPLYSINVPESGAGEVAESDMNVNEPLKRYTMQQHP